MPFQREANTFTKEYTGKHNNLRANTKPSCSAADLNPVAPVGQHPRARQEREDAQEGQPWWLWASWGDEEGSETRHSRAGTPCFDPHVALLQGFVSPPDSAVGCAPR